MVIVKWFKKKIAEREEQIWKEDKEHRKKIAKGIAVRKASEEKDAEKLRIEREMKKFKQQPKKQQAIAIPRQSSNGNVSNDVLPPYIHMHQTYDTPSAKEVDCGGREHKVTHSDSFAYNSCSPSYTSSSYTSSSYDSGSSSSSSSSSSDSGSSSSYDSGGGSFD